MASRGRDPASHFHDDVLHLSIICTMAWAVFRTYTYRMFHSIIQNNLLLIIFIFLLFCMFFFFLFIAFLRLDVILQEEKIQRLSDKVLELTSLNRKCDRLRRKENRFLQTLIQTSKRDNVPLSEEQCSTFCRKNKVKGQVCQTLCSSASSTASTKCTHWTNKGQKCLNRHHSKRSTKPENNVLLVPSNSSDDTSTFLTNSQNRPLYQVPDPIVTGQDEPQINVKYFGDLGLRSWSPKASCGSLTCTVEPGMRATLCFQKTDPGFYFQFGQHQNTKGTQLIYVFSTLYLCTNFFLSN
jgi:hypothetical protein